MIIWLKDDREKHGVREKPTEEKSTKSLKKPSNLYARKKRTFN